MIESIIIGCAIMSSTSRPYILEHINVNDFEVIAHKNIFSSVKYLYDSQQSIDLPMLSKELMNKGLYEDCISYLTESLDNWTGSDIKPIVKELVERSCRKQINEMLLNAAQASTDKQYSIDQICYGIDKRIKDITKNRDNDIHTFAELAGLSPEEIAEKDKYYMTGYKDIDAGMAGLFQTDLILIGARPSLGKSALVQNILTNIAKRYKDEHVLWFSLEMKFMRIAKRGISQEARVDSFIIKTKRYESQEQREKIQAGIYDLSTIKNLHIVDNVNTLDGIVNTSKTFAQTNKLSVIAIDYLQLISYTGQIHNEDFMLGEISKGLKSLAIQLNVPVVVISALNRKVEERKDKRPILADLRSSGKIEFDSDVVLFLYKDAEEDLSKDKYILECAKGRDGKLFTADLYFNGNYTLFEDI